jgi:GxxExxY protein
MMEENDDVVGQGLVAEPSPEINLLAERVLDAAFEVHRELGPGFPEVVYENAMAIELEAMGLECVKQQSVSLRYKEHVIGEGRLDLLVERRLIVELKAVESLTSVHTAQVLSYLRATYLPLALLLNFNVKRLATGIRRVVLSRMR